MNAEDVLSPRAGIAEVRWALLDESPRKALRGAIQGLLEEGAGLRTCRLRRAKFKPGRKLTVHYDAWVRSDGRDLKRPVVAVWDREGGILGDARASALEAEAVRAGLAAPFRSLLAWLPGWNVSVRVFPLDPRFPQLIHLCDPRRVAAMLASRLPEAFGVGYRISPIRYRPGERHVLRYEPSGAPVAPGRAVFAKLSRPDVDVARAFRVATGVADQLDASGGATRAVRPLGVVAEDGLILFREIAGRPMSKLPRFPGGGATGHLRRAGHALRALHTGPAPCTEALGCRDFATEVDAVGRASEHLCALLPRLGAMITDTLERARSAYDRLPSESPTFTHGDFKADHLWVSRGGLTLLDFGSCALGDPALDIGKFLADLQWWSALSGRGSASAQRAFLASYATGSEARLLRARVYEALFLVMCAAHRVPLYHSAWAARSARLVQQAGAVLDQLP